MMVGECAGNALEIALVLGREPGPVAGKRAASPAAPAQCRCIQQMLSQFLRCPSSVCVPSRRCNSWLGPARLDPVVDPRCCAETLTTLHWNGQNSVLFQPRPASGNRVLEPPIYTEMNWAWSRGALQCEPSRIIAPFSGAEISPAQQIKLDGRAIKMGKGRDRGPRRRGFEDDNYSPPPSIQRTSPAGIPKRAAREFGSKRPAHRCRRQMVQPGQGLRVRRTGRWLRRRLSAHRRAASSRARRGRA